MTEDEETRRREYLDERDNLLEGRTKAAERFETALITLSGGALVLSITFLHNIAPDRKWIAIMIFSWGFLLASLTLMLLIFFLGIYAYEKDMNALGEEYVTQTLTKRPVCLIKWLQILEGTSIGFFIGGSILFALFAAVNLSSFLPK